MACGPDPKPGPLCDGPTFNLVVKTEDDQPLPSDTRLNVRYGGNHEGEAYALGVKPTKQAVHCDEVRVPPDAAGGGGAAGALADEGGAGGAGPTSTSNSPIFALSCRLYTQGPARVDVTATGYEPIEKQDLTLDEKKRCRVEVEVQLQVLMDAGT
ncbi:MAG TPA: hypothetical protein VJN18_00115 [Polyangiaceae bacterium]|nr:hypothetical protein [Polyangiaceae bacterium]